jgi:hypothetical protein
VLEAFDSVRGQHESVAAEDFNNDDAFKSMTNEARTLSECSVAGPNSFENISSQPLAQPSQATVQHEVAVREGCEGCLKYRMIRGLRDTTPSRMI